MRVCHSHGTDPEMHHDVQWLSASKQTDEAEIAPWLVGRLIARNEVPCPVPSYMPTSQ